MDAYITEFQRLVVMVTDISEQQLVMLFIEGLTEPLRGWVKAFKPDSLQDAIMKTRDMEYSTSSIRAPSKPFTSHKDKGKKPFQKRVIR